MPEVRNLDIKIKEVEGWHLSEGQSQNIWGIVPFPREILNLVKSAKKRKFILTNLFKKQNTKSPIWTAYDKYIYDNIDTIDDLYLPRISATFKSCFAPYSAVSENLGMRIACELDMPTSYNYIVRFNPKEYPEIIENYANKNKINSLQPVGIVSIDFLQNSAIIPVNEKTEMTIINENKQCINYIKALEGDRLVTFQDGINKYMLGINKLSGEQNLLETWIKIADLIAREELKDCDKSIINKTLEKINNRIAKSFLLREYLGDSDFTDYNGGLVVNTATKTVRYAPNHDFGESFNPLIRNKLSKDVYCGMTKEQFMTLPENIRNTIIKSKEKQYSSTIDDISKQYASGTSRENLYFVFEHFHEVCTEFFENLDSGIQKKKLEKLVDEYTILTVNGKPLLTKEEADYFNEYLECRASWLCELYVDFCLKKDIKNFLGTNLT